MKSLSAKWFWLDFLNAPSSNEILQEAKLLSGTSVCHII